MKTHGIFKRTCCNCTGLSGIPQTKLNVQIITKTAKTCVVSYPRCPRGSTQCVSFSCFNMLPTHKHTRTHPRLFIPKGAPLKERKPLNHVPVPCPRYQPRLMSSPLMKKKKKTGGAHPSCRRDRGEGVGVWGG